MKKLIYIKSFTAKQELVVEPVPGTVHEAILIGESYSIELGGYKDTPAITLILQEGITDNGNFSCDMCVVTKDNYKSLNLSKEDKKLADKMFRENAVKKAAEEAEKAFDKQIDNAFDELGTLSGNDPFLLISMAKVAKHINKTFNDKYNDDTPAVDLQGLMRHSPHGRPFNIGNACKYLRRYLTDGFAKSNDTEDLLKAVHYILFELDRRDNVV